MSYINLMTESGVKFNAPLKKRSDFQRVISLLKQENDIVALTVTKKRAYIRLKTDNGVSFNAPLKTRSDYERAVKLLEQEMSILSATTATLATETTARPVKKVKREAPGTAEFLEGTSTK